MIPVPANMPSVFLSRYKDAINSGKKRGIQHAKLMINTNINYNTIT